MFCMAGIPWPKIVTLASQLRGIPTPHSFFGLLLILINSNTSNAIHHSHGYIFSHIHHSLRFSPTARTYGVKKIYNFRPHIV
jgi:hypothetical protein